MKATGIVRRIDDLGRVVIPKEIRRTLRIRESDPMEIFTDREGQIILKKYSPIGELNMFAKEYTEALAQAAGCIACIADKDQILQRQETDGENMSRKPLAENWKNRFQIEKIFVPQSKKNLSELSRETKWNMRLR